MLAPSSGSRGVYGAIGTAGDWGLKRGCAVALTDAGKGLGLYDLTDDTVHKVDGTRATRTAAGTLSNFAATITDAARSAFNAAFPNRVALKHAHSQLNPEKDWGNDTLAAATYALYVLNQQYAPVVDVSGARGIRFTAANTVVIAASASNGGTSVLRAAEHDTAGLIDGVVAAEPGAQASVIYNDSVGGARLWTLGVSPSTGAADFSLDAALCQRALYTGVNTVGGAVLTAASTPTKAQSDAVRAGVAEVLLNGNLRGNLRGKPTLMLAGRGDTLLPVNNSERAYTAFNRKVEGGTSKLSYIEVTNAQHFDTFNSLSGWDTRFVPLHGYFVQAMNAMYANREKRRGAAGQPGGADHASRRGARPGPCHHGGQCAGYQHGAGRRQSDRFRRNVGQCA